MKNPKTTIIGIIQLLVTLIAALKPDLVGIDWANIDIQAAIMAGAAAVVSGGIALYNIFFAGDKEGGV